MDIHTWQKWNLLWPILRQFPQESVQLLDAGCGRGSWILRLARRRPVWGLSGVDIDGNALREALEAFARAGNVVPTLVCSDFLDYEPQFPFDLVLSVASAHYLAKKGQDMAVFQKFRDWLRPGGRLILLAPRCRSEMPRWPILPSLSCRDVFTVDRLRTLCRDTGLVIERLEGSIGSLGALAKQFEKWFSKGLACPLRWVALPFLVGLTIADKLLDSKLHERSVFLLLVARVPDLPLDHTH